jgi:hypothetical protein
MKQTNSTVNRGSSLQEFSIRKRQYELTGRYGDKDFDHGLKFSCLQSILWTRDQGDLHTRDIFQEVNPFFVAHPWPLSIFLSFRPLYWT